MDPSAARALDAQVAGCAAAHQRLLATLDAALDGGDLAGGRPALDDAACRAPSRLPGWSRGHLLTHLARNAESHAGMFDAAGRGEAREQYPGGAPARAAAIEAGAGRAARALVADVRSTIWVLEGAWASATAATWAGHGVKSHAGGGRVAVADLVAMRWRETEVHLADLDLGPTWRDWSDDFVRMDVASMTTRWASRRPMGMAALPQAALRLDPRERLAWLLGRHEVAGLPAPEPF